MRLLALIAALLFALSSRAEPLRQLLKDGGIPESSFSKAELDAEINGAVGSTQQIVLATYLRIQGDTLAGNPQLVRYDRTSGAILRAQVKPEDEGLCCGSPLAVEFIGDFALLSFHINPSASAIMVLGEDLKLVTTLFGFELREVLPDKIVLIENMIHFAPAHPERLQLADLHNGQRMELYPPQGDALRAAFAREHAAHMPPHNTCEKMNDPCQPDLYDEDIAFLDVDGHGTFSFTVHRDAAHATGEEQPPDSVASEAVLYRYSWNGRGWLYCEEKLSDYEAKSLDGSQAHDNKSSTKSACTPTLPVAADMSTSDFSPFDRQRTEQHAESNKQMTFMTQAIAC
jgi:hypothetical protein